MVSKDSRHNKLLKGNQHSQSGNINMADAGKFAPKDDMDYH